MPWAGRAVTPGLVLYVGAEGAGGLRNRITAFRQHYDLQAPVPFALLPAAIDLQDPKADVRRLAATIEAACDRMATDPALIVVDTLSKTFGGGKENSDDMAVYVANAQSLASQFECLVMPIHHRPKDAESTEPRGHSSLKGGVDTIVLVESGATKRATITKQKDGESGAEFLFQLTSVELGVDEDGDPVTSCVVAMTDIDDTPPKSPFLSALAKLPTKSRLIFDQLGDLIEAQGEPVPAIIPADQIDRMWVTRVANFGDWRDRVLATAGTSPGHERDKAYESAKKAFNRAKERLQSDGIVRVWNDFAWITHKLPSTCRDSAGTNAGTGVGQAGQKGSPLKGGTPKCPGSVPVPGGDVLASDLRLIDLDHPDAPDTNPGWSE